MSEDYFSQMNMAPPAATAAKSRSIGGVGSSTAGTAARRRGGPPPPPPRAGRGATGVGSTSTAARTAATPTTSSSSSYYGSKSAVPPPKASMSIGGIGTKSTSTSSISSTAKTAAPSMYGNSTFSNSNPQSSSASSFYGTGTTASTNASKATVSSSSYYSSSSPTLSSTAAPNSVPSNNNTSPMFSSTPAPAPASQQPQSSYSTTTSAATTDFSSDWYTPQPQQQQQQPQMNTQSSYYGTQSSAPAPAAPTPAPIPTAGQHTGSSNPAMVNTWNPAAPVPKQQQQPQNQHPSQDSLDGKMDTAAPVANLWSGPMGGGTNNTSTTASSTKAPSSYGAQPYDPTEFENDPPLLEELGIHIPHIVFKTRAVLLPFSRFHKNHSTNIDPKAIVADADLAGPLTFALLLGGELLLTGKIQFGYIYGFGVFGCLAMTLILNLMSPTEPVSVWTVTSVLGYALLPVNLLAAVKVISLGYMETFGRILALGTIAWCTVASTRLLEQGCGMRDQRYLIGYPIALVYSAFVMITIF